MKANLHGQYNTAFAQKTWVEWRVLRGAIISGVETREQYYDYFRFQNRYPNDVNSCSLPLNNYHNKSFCAPKPLNQKPPPIAHHYIETMPRARRAAKKDIHPKTLNIDYLQTLTRLQIQGLAKNYGVKANLRTEQIITDILAKADLRRSQSPKTSPKRFSNATKKPEEPTALEEPLVEEESVPALRTTRRTTKRASPDQPSNETKKSSKRARGRRAIAQPPNPNEHSADIQNREDVKRHIDPEKQQARKDRVSQVSINARQISGAQTDNAGSTTNSKKPTTQDIHELHKVLVELGEERDKLRNKLNESKLSLAYAMDALESGALLLEEMKFRRQLYEREVIYRLLQVDDLESMRADARKDWQKYLEEEGWNDWTPELS
ncbi:hypothetical protein JR316_0002425 [Psilocybe cubensis]|uniref:Uncharacterized protein n=2 Tax=Psilocybe cubensis TaxID=181762 RepID=A0ACB8HD04_PSICU|nr:hypothetical protein JR316_0002425 [Psilocybe cubensis]KAH9485517.1 hypothetical protein JR316_0002425 [Psilocybe cubensis]